MAPRALLSQPACLAWSWFPGRWAWPEATHFPREAFGEPAPPGLMLHRPSSAPLLVTGLPGMSRLPAGVPHPGAGTSGLWELGPGVKVSLGPSVSRGDSSGCLLLWDLPLHLLCAPPPGHPVTLGLSRGRRPDKVARPAGALCPLWAVKTAFMPF